jgi:hypothetical protein
LKIFKIIFAVAMGVYGVWGAFQPHAFGLLNGANLLFHEGGHMVFGIFGDEMLSMFGGTFMQLLLPAAVTLEFLRERRFYSACIGLFWFGQNCFHIAVYAKDATAQILPLVGGGIHDWNYLLGKFGVLSWDQEIGTVIWALGLILVVASSVGGVYYGFKHKVNES